MAKCKRNRNRTKRSFTVKEPKANRNYKDTVFRMLFSDRKNLLSLYNAVNQTDYRNPEELENMLCLIIAQKQKQKQENTSTFCTN